MSKPWIHAQSSAKQFGGTPEDYMEIHEFMDCSKSVTSLATHRALTHNTFFISMVLPRVFGETFVRKSDNKVVSTRDIGEQHVAEDFRGVVPSASDFLDSMELQPWMMNKGGSPPSHQRTGKVRRKRPEPVEEVDLSTKFTPIDMTQTFDGFPYKPVQPKIDPREGTVPPDFFQPRYIPPAPPPGLNDSLMID